MCQVIVCMHSLIIDLCVSIITNKSCKHQNVWYLVFKSPLCANLCCVGNVISCYFFYFSIHILNILFLPAINIIDVVCKVTLSKVFKGDTLII